MRGGVDDFLGRLLNREMIYISFCVFLSEPLLKALLTPIPMILIVFIKKIEDICPVCAVFETPVLDFSGRLPWVSKPGYIPRSHASLPTCNRFLRFTSGATPADLLATSMAAEPFDPHNYTCV